MLTYQDYLEIDNTDIARADFCRNAITQHMGTDLYKIARDAEEYDKGLNTTTMQYQKMITDVYGRLQVDKLATVHRSTSNFFNIFTSQLNQYLLGNGVTWKNESFDMGKTFDTMLQKAGKYALVGGVSFGFWDMDHLVVFKVTEFVPLYDEETGGLAAGVRFWQIDSEKPLRATLYEMDGYTEFMWTSTRKPSDQWQPIGEDVFILPKVAYVRTVATSKADGVRILDGENYPSFPIVPLWGNPHRQSELVGMKEKIDAYDFILNGWENDLDNAQIYWIIRGAGGMDDSDLMRFLDRLRTVGAAAPEDGQDVQPVTTEIPTAARESLLERLEIQLYRDSMMMNPAEVSGGAVTATQIRAAYERQNIKADQFEYCVIDFVQGILEIAGHGDEEFTFTRSRVLNVNEEINTIVLAASYLGTEYVTRKILTILGDGDQADEVIRQVDAEMLERLRQLGVENNA